MFFSVQNLPDVQDSKYLVLRMSFPHAFSGNPVPDLSRGSFSLNERQLPFAIPFPHFHEDKFLIAFLFEEPHRCHLSLHNTQVDGHYILK